MFKTTLEILYDLKLKIQPRFQPILGNILLCKRRDDRISTSGLTFNPKFEFAMPNCFKLKT